MAKIDVSSVTLKPGHAYVFEIDVPDGAGATSFTTVMFCVFEAGGEFAFSPMRLKGYNPDGLTFYDREDLAFYIDSTGQVLAANMVGDGEATVVVTHDLGELDFGGSK